MSGAAHLSSIFAAYCQYTITTTQGGTPVALFTAPASRPVTYATGMGFACSAGVGQIAHDVISLERKLTDTRGLPGVDTSVWERALADLQRQGGPRPQTLRAA